VAEDAMNGVAEEFVRQHSTGFRDGDGGGDKEPMDLRAMLREALRTGAIATGLFVLLALFGEEELLRLVETGPIDPRSLRILSDRFSRIEIFLRTVGVGRRTDA
jgi:hypothetical protein